MKSILFIVGLSVLSFSGHAFAQDENPRIIISESDGSETSETHYSLRSEEFKPGSQRWKVALGYAQMLGTSDIKFNNARFSNSSQRANGRADYYFEPSYSIYAEARFLGPQSWGFISGVMYEGKRSFERGSLIVGNQKVTMNGGGPSSSIQTTSLYASAAYMFEKFYFPFGLNVSSVRYTPYDGSPTDFSTDTSSAIGGQLGVGYMVTENFTVELVDWITRFGMVNTGQGVQLNYGTGTVSNLNLLGKVVF